MTLPKNGQESHMRGRIDASLNHALDDLCYEVCSLVLFRNASLRFLGSRPVLFVDLWFIPFFNFGKLNNTPIWFSSALLKRGRQSDAVKKVKITIQRSAMKQNNNRKEIWNFLASRKFGEEKKSISGKGKRPWMNIVAAKKLLEERTWDMIIHTNREWTCEVA